MEKIKKIFICSPYRGDVQKNIQNTKKYCKKVIENSCIPIAPHLYFPQFLNDENQNERCIGIMFGLELLQECDCIMVFGQPTDGMKKEIKYAEDLNKEIKYVSL